ncbi:DUF6086 family protein [Streptomyces sp. 3N207]|uniref:DUF6086 family protein n=1 Tax=Streptomyces sp. 3N207 TaxID=3457417 RepID=UPI003FD49256
MSQYVDLGDETLWNPSNGAARLFLRQAAVFEAELGVPCGIGPMQSDECQVDPAVLKDFVDALLAWRHRTSHGVMGALADGFIATVLVLAERARIDVRWRRSTGPVIRGVHTDVHLPALSPFGEEEWTIAVRAKARELSRCMAR